MSPFRRLRNAHSLVVDRVCELAALDVLKEVNKWKEGLNVIRSKVSTASRYDYLIDFFLAIPQFSFFLIMENALQMQEEEQVHNASKQNIRPWQLHWDRQLFKVFSTLECFCSVRAKPFLEKGLTLN